MKSKSTRKYEDRSMTVNFHDEATYHRLREDGRAFVEFVVAFIMSVGFQLKHKCECPGGCCLTRHTHYSRVRLGGLVIWRLQCKHCKAVFTILPHFVLRYRCLNPERAKQVVLASYGGLSLEWSARVFPDVSAMAVYRLLCSFGQSGIVSVLSRCHVPLPAYILADEKHSSCVGDKVYLPTIVSGRLVWHLGYTEEKSADAFEASYGEFRQAARAVEPTYAPKGIVTDGFESTRKSLRKLFPRAALGNCLRHARQRVGQKLQAVTSSVRKALSQEFYNIFQQDQRTKLLPVFTVAQRLRRFREKVAKQTGAANGVRIREWIRHKKAGWFAVIQDPNMPARSTLLDQAHNILDRKLFMMKGFHHDNSLPQPFLNGFALLYNFVPYQRRAQHAGKCGVEIEGGNVPTDDWFLNLRIATSGGFQ